ncbi:MAG: riboflavin synthase [Acidobacteriota bacterium]
MFTGIIEAVGRITAISPLGGGDAGVRLRVDAGTLDCADIALGDSVAVSGACLTVVAKSNAQLEFDVSAESLRCTAGLAQPGPVNLEKALRFGDRLGGHLVSGHVDGVGIVRQFHPAGESHALEVEAPAELARYIAVKGSITVDGVSLTVNKVQGARFAVNLIPHTLTVTTLEALRTGQPVNLEVDLLARYLERLVDGRELTVIGSERLR